MTSMSPAQPLRSILGPLIASYLALKQALGRLFTVEKNVLLALDRFLASSVSGSADLTSESFAAWGQSIAHLSSGVRRNHMRIVRNLCLYRRRNEPSCFVPDIAHFPPLHQPIEPYIFTEADIRRLLQATEALTPTPGSPLRRETFRLAIVLLYTAGLRRRELVRLTLADFNSLECCLTVRATKFHKARLVPLSADAAREVEDYLKTRSAHHLPMGPDTPLLWNGYYGGRPYCGGGIGQGMRCLFRTAGVHKPDGHLPRVHDFRHTFAVHALLRWYRSGVDLQAKLPHLATYMGHVSIVSTEYYLHFVQEIAQEASQRFEKYCGRLISPVPAGKEALP